MQPHFRSHALSGRDKVSLPLTFGAEEPRILYNDNQIVVVCKPTGMLSIPGRGEAKADAVTPRIRERFSFAIDQPSVHRLDMDTSGLMVLGLTKSAHRALSIQFEKREVEKEYVALVDGEPAGSEGLIELAFRLDPENRPYQIFDPLEGKIGITHWEKICTGALRSGILFTQLRLKPLTGRTHQLRLHTSHPAGLGCPILGDRLYSPDSTKADRLMLHASRLIFSHPETGKRLEFNSPPPFPST